MKEISRREKEVLYGIQTTCNEKGHEWIKIDREHSAGEAKFSSSFTKRCKRCGTMR